MARKKRQQNKREVVDQPETRRAESGASSARKVSARIAQRHEEERRAVDLFMASGPHFINY